MKAWQWVLLGVAAIVVIIIIREESKTTVLPGSMNSNIAAQGLGSFLATMLHATPVSAPAASNVPPGSSGFDFTGGGAGSFSGTPASYGAQYSAAMGSTGETASRINYGVSPTGSGGTTNGGGLSDPLGIGTLNAPSFDVGTGGADFSN